MKFVRFLLMVLEVALIVVPGLYYRAAADTGNVAIVIAFFALNIAFIDSLNYLYNFVKDLGKPTR